MKFGKFSDYRGGWLVGDFNPSLFKTNANDIGVLYCKEGEKGDGHFHKEHVEYILVQITMNVKALNRLNLLKYIISSDLLFK